MSRDAALARYQELPVPDTTQEAWRFTNLRGFDPNAFDAEPDEGMFQTESMLPELEVAGWAEVSETGPARPLAARDRGRALRGARRERPAAPSARRLGREVHGAQRGALEARPARARAEGRRARAAALRAHRQLGAGRLDLLAPARGRRGGLALHADRGVRLGRARPARLHQRGRRGVRRAGGEVRVRLDPEPLARDLALRHAPRARRARRRARLGRGRVRLEEREDPHPERPQRPRRHVACHRRLLRRRRAAPRLRHLPGAHRPVDRVGLRLQGRAARVRRTRCGAG